jgi:hypothetical protein
MNTRSLSPVLAAGLWALVLSGCATLSSGAVPGVDVAIKDGGHLDILSGYLRKSDDRAVVRGMVRRRPLWQGPVDGHLHIVAYAADGRVLAQGVARWSGSLGGRTPRAAPYQVELEARRDDVARLAVSYAPGRHTAAEGVQ